MFYKFFTPSKFTKISTLALGFSAYSLFQDYRRRQKCCGIIGVLSTHKNAQQVITEGIQLLQNRGYDSAGIVTFTQNQQKEVEEEKNCIERVVSEGLSGHTGSFIGIGHTRWATCGGKTSPNAHPHYDQSKQFYLVHNGTIVNYKQLKEKYLKDTVFTSETDTEVIVQLLAKECRQNNLSVFQALKKIQDQMIGQWGLVIINKNKPQEMHIATYGSPILVGLSNDEIFVASQTIAFQKYTKRYIETKNGETLKLSLDSLKQLEQQMEAKGRILKITNEVKIKYKPDPPFLSFYEQEVYQQGILKFKPYLASLDGIQFRDNLTILGCGSSFYASLYTQYFFKKLKSFKKVHVLDAAQMIPQDIQEEQSLILVSQSGETKDLLAALEMSKKKKNVKSIGVINVVGSALARNVDAPVYTNVGREVAVGSTKSFSHQILNLLAIAVHIAEKKGFGDEAFLKQLKAELYLIPQKFKQAISMVHNKIKQITKIIKDIESMYLLAKSQSIAIAKQGALKIKELCYIHAQAFGASQMKHGPLALVNSQKPKSTVVLFIILDDKSLNALKVAIDQLHSRRAYIIVITNCLSQLNIQKIDQYAQIPKLNQLGSLLALVPLQLIANEICVWNGIKPDKPRNLAKTVTV